jgi:hypothetical protein
MDIISVLIGTALTSCTTIRASDGMTKNITNYRMWHIFTTIQTLLKRE